MNIESLWPRAALLAGLLGSVGIAQTTTLVSVGPGGVPGNGGSYADTSRAISSDGRFVVFDSDATNLVPGDTNGRTDVFIHDCRTGVTSRVSVDSAGAQGNDESWDSAVSADGRYVVFISAATNLVSGDTNASLDVFVHDRLRGDASRVSVDSAGAQGNGRSGLSGVAISADGRFVAFESTATNLVPGDTNAASDVFLHDRQTGATTRVSVDSSGAQGNFSSYAPALSADGQHVAFVSAASHLVPGDTNSADDIFVRDMAGARTLRVSVSSSGVEANSDCMRPSISADGQVVAFDSTATNLDPGDTNGYDDVFVHDRLSALTSLASRNSTGVHGNGYSFVPSISADGRWVAFDGWSTNLVPGDTNHCRDVFLHDRESGNTSRVSVNSAGWQGRGNSSIPSISADGRYVAFESNASNLDPGDTVGVWDVYVRDRGGPPLPAPLCFGDSSAGPCPCGNNGSPGRGCENSAASGGALLLSWGTASLSDDTLVLASFGEVPSASSVFFQGDTAGAAVSFGDGLRCVRGSVKRLYVAGASGGGLASAPPAGTVPVSVRSAALGDPIPVGATRYYQSYYRDSDPAFCPSPPGGDWNASNALSVLWYP